MIVNVDREYAVTVRDADDFKSFAVAIDHPLGDAAPVARKILPFIDIETAEHAWVDVALLIQASGREGDELWMSGFGKMLAYASNSGWVRQGGRSVRGHIKWRS